MAESNSKTGILAFAQKRLARTKTKVLQNLGKAEKTTDDIFNDNVLRVERQQEVAHHLQKELKSYVHCLREMSQASKSLTTALSEVYEPEWTKESAFKAQLQTFDLLWNDLLQSVQDSVIVPVSNYLQSFPVLKAKIAKRGRKIVDYDNCRHHLEVLLSAKKKDDVRIHKAEEEMKEAKRIYDGLHNELRSELPEFNNSRVTFYAGLLSSLFGAEHVFHSEVGKINEMLYEVCQELGKDFEQFVYQPKRALSKSVSSNSGDNGFSDDISGTGSPSSLLARTSVGSTSSSPIRDLSLPVYNNQEVPEIKQRFSIPTSQHNGTSPVLQATKDRKSASVSDQDGSKKANDVKDYEEDGKNAVERKAVGHSVYEEPKEAPSVSTAMAYSTNHDTNHDTESDSDVEQEEWEPTYSNPSSNQPLTSPPPNTLYIVQAVHRYTGEDVDELSFEPGEIIYVIEFENPEEQDEGWQTGIKASDGVKGVFPENFTQLLSAEGR